MNESEFESYVVVTDISPTKVAERVTAYLRVGYELYGSLVVTGIVVGLQSFMHYAQAMAKRKCRRE